MQKTARIEVRVTPLERHAIQEAAADNRDTLSQFVRRTALAQANAEPFLSPDEIDALDQLREQLRRAGINLNTMLRDLQGADLHRQRELPQPSEWETVRADLTDVLQKVRGLLGSRI